jgi:hypothetical protein
VGHHLDRRGVHGGRRCRVLARIPSARRRGSRFNAGEEGPKRVGGGGGVQAEGSGEERRRCRGSQRHGRWWRVNTEAATAMWEDDGGRTDGELAKVRWKVGWSRFPRPERTGRRIFPSRWI